MLSGTRANIAVKIFGDDLVTLRRLGERVRAAMAGVGGVVDLSLEQQMDIPFVRFVLNRAAIARYGLRVQDVAEAIETSFAGTTVGRVFDRGDRLRPGGQARSVRGGRLRADRATCRSTRRPASRCRSACWPTSGARRGRT